MNAFVLTIVDTQGIQNYIYGTNQLAQNVGASFLVKAATHQWVVDALPTPHNVLPRLELNEAITIESDGLKAEVVYLGGGNAVILFRTLADAHAFARKLTTRALTDAPGLQIVVAHSEPFDIEQVPLGGRDGIVQQTMRVLARRKQNRPLDSPLLGMSVTAAGVYTGLPATTHDKERRLISAEAAAKINAAEQAHQALSKEFEWHGYDIPRDFDHFGRSEGEKSYIAIVHADVNGMGKKITAIRDHFPNAFQNRAYIQAMRAISDSMKEAANTALQEAITLLANSIQPDDDGHLQIIGQPDNDLRVPMASIDGNDKLPIRPIVYGGDDVTFVTDGRLGLSLATYYLKRLTSQTLAGPDKERQSIYARAGVAIVKTHFPFARAYALTEELVASAKTFIKEHNAELTALDWHIQTGSLVADLQSIREREYRAENGHTLLMRPVALSNSANWRTWRDFMCVTLAFQIDDAWRERRNKVKALREILRQGTSETIEHFINTYGTGPLPSLPSEPSSNLPKKGWVGGRTPYFDAIETMDFFIPLFEEACK